MDQFDGIISGNSKRNQIQRLDDHLQRQIGSGLRISTFSQCIEELVLNSIDAKSTHILVNIDPNNLNVEVCDNGNGINSENLKFVALRHYTNKCPCSTDLQSFEHIGYRGEALASICNLTKIMEIQTRTTSSPNTYVKKFINSHPIYNGIMMAEIPRNYVGTTVKLTNVFYNLPVRQNMAINRWDRERYIIKQRLEALAIIHHRIKITLQLNGDILFQSPECNDISASIYHLYGTIINQTFQKVRFDIDKFQFNGCINTIPGNNSHGRFPQYIYLNGRLMHKNIIYDALNWSLLANSKFFNRYCGQDTNDSHNSLTSDRSGNIQIRSLSNLHNCYMYIVHIVCPISEYIIVEASFNKVQFIQQDVIFSGMKKLCDQYFVQNRWITSEELPYLDQAIYVPPLSQSKKHTNPRKYQTKKSVMKKKICSCSSNKTNGYEHVNNIWMRPVISDVVCRQSTSQNTNNSCNVKSTDDNCLQYQQSYEDQDQAMIDLVNINHLISNSVSLVKAGQSPVNIDLYQRCNILCTQNNENVLATPPNTLTKEMHIVPLPNKDTFNQTTRQPLIGTRAKDMKPSSFANDNITLINNISTVPSSRKKKRMALTKSIEKNIRSNYKTKEMICRLKTRMANYRITGIHNLNPGRKTLSAAKKLCKTTVALKISPTALKNCQIVGQVDNKFIACILEDDSKEKYLSLVDQHAADERVRLENLITEYRQNPENGLISVRVRPSIKYATTNDVFSAIQSSRDSLRRLGIQFLNQYDGKAIDIVSVPKLLISNEVFDRQKTAFNDISAVNSKAVNVIQLKSDGFSSTFHLSSNEVAKEILCSKACHGAIRFGDRLSPEIIANLICQLSECKLPFQCAHGRPSLVPLLKLSSL